MTNIKAQIKYEGTRKELVTDIANAYGVKAKYLGAPTFAYQVADVVITRDNCLVWEGTTPSDELTPIGKLVAEGRFQYAGLLWVDGKEYNLQDFDRGAETPAQTATVAPTSEETEQGGTTTQAVEGRAHAAISIPDDFTDKQYDNLRNLVEQKQNLLKKAFPGLTDVILRAGETIDFPWFAMDADLTACRMFIERFAALAKNAKRVSTKQNPVTNPKYQFRCFLLRLGFIGKKYGPARKALMQHLEGNSAWLRGSRDA